jgi:hypothetical protein
MSELLTYGVLGFHHIADLNAADHILFLLALSATYRLSQWRPALWVITAFTVGHSLTLGLAVTGALSFPTAVIEFLIPVTIVITCLENLRSLGQPNDERRVPLRAGLALVFGLVHGAGFANYLKAMFVDQVTLPLLGFNLGIEVGQVMILLLAGAGFALADRTLGLLSSAQIQPFRARVITVSAVVAILAGRMVVERSLW